MSVRIGVSSSDDVGRESLPSAFAPEAVARVKPAPRQPADAAAGQHAQAGDPVQRAGESLEQCVLRSLDQYFVDLNGARPHALHEMVLAAVEKPLLRFVLARCGGNQSAAAGLLGMNRNTLRRKLQDYGLH